MAKGSIKMGVATKVAGIIATKSFDAVSNFIRNFNSGKITPEDLSALQMEIEKLKIKLEEADRECEMLKKTLFEKEKLIKKLNTEKESLSKKLVLCLGIAFALFVALIVFIMI